MKKFNRILCIGDLHCPFEHPQAFDFLAKTAEKYEPDKIVLLGDEIDFHKISFHPSSEELPFSASAELDEAIKRLKNLYEIFPKASIVDSNHGSLVYRKLKFHGVPLSVLKPWNKIIEAPKQWEWSYDLTLNSPNGEIYFHHGLGANALAMSQMRGQNLVQGHYHTNFNASFWANSKNLYWAVSSGCLIDGKSLAFEYAKNNIKKPLLGCVMILDGMPKLIPMVLNERGAWNKRVL